MKNFLRYLLAIILFCCVPLVLHAMTSDEEIVSIDSDLADYNGDKITLQGNVVIKHALGIISANQIIVDASNKKEGSLFRSLRMLDHVNLAFQEGGDLSCSRADIDYQALIGNFFGSKDQEYVTYTEKEGDVVPLIVKSHFMSCHLVSKNIKGDKTIPKHNVSILTADGQVSVDYNNDFIVTADHAIYNRVPAIDEATAKINLPGTLIMTAAKENGTCQVSNREGAMITASKIGIDTVNRHLTFMNPEGTLKNSAKSIGKIDFSAETLDWDDLNGILTLCEQVEVSQEGIGKLKTAEKVIFHQSISNQKKALKGIETMGDTILTYREEDKNLSHVLTCPGPVKVDHEKMETRLLPQNKTLTDISENRQVHFEDAKGEIFADKVLIKYEIVEGQIAISKILLYGNVKIYNRLNSADDETIVVCQYGLADRVEFKPHSNEMVFKSFNQAGRVLFFDKMNNLQVSAQALKIIRDKATKKETVKGLGDVRFSFLESEFEQLRQRFYLNINAPKEETVFQNQQAINEE